MGKPPRIHDEDTSPGAPPAEPLRRPAHLDDTLGLPPVDDEPTLVPAGEARVGPGPEVPPRPPTGETRRPTDRGVVPPPLPRAEPEGDPAAPPAQRVDPRTLVRSALVRVSSPQAEPTDVGAARTASPDVHVRSTLMRKKGAEPPTADTHVSRPPVEPPRLPPPAPLSRPSARPVIRPGREPKSLASPASELLHKPIVRPSGKNLVAPAQKEPTDPARSPRPGDLPALPEATATSRPSSLLTRPPPPRSTDRAIDRAVRGPPPRDEVAAREGHRHLPLGGRERTDTAAGPSYDPAARPRVFEALALVTLGLLLVVIVLPTDAGAPWQLVLRPTEPSFIALAALLLVAVARFIPWSPRVRAALALVTGVLVLGLALMVMRGEVGAGFDAQPALVALLQGAPAIGVALVVAATLVPAGLFLRALAPRHLAATGLVGFGAALVLAVALGVGSIFDQMPLVMLIDGMSDGAMLGDRVAAAVALPAVALLAASLVFTFPGFGRRVAAPLGVVLWAIAFAPVLTLALFAAPASAYLAALAAVKLVVLVAAAALYLAAGLAATLSPAPAR